jgi:hypothetical protein
MQPPSNPGTPADTMAGRLTRPANDRGLPDEGVRHASPLLAIDSPATFPGTTRRSRSMNPDTD